MHEIDRVYEELLDDKVHFHENGNNQHHLGGSGKHGNGAHGHPHSNATHSSTKNVIDLNKIQQLRKRKASMVSLLRNKVQNVSNPGSEVKPRLNLRTTIIDFNRLCDDIYLCDWV